MKFSIIILKPHGLTSVPNILSVLQKEVGSVMLPKAFVSFKEVGEQNNNHIVIIYKALLVCIVLCREYNVREVSVLKSLQAKTRQRETTEGGK